LITKGFEKARNPLCEFERQRRRNTTAAATPTSQVSAENDRVPSGSWWDLSLSIKAPANVMILAMVIKDITMNAFYRNMITDTVEATRVIKNLFKNARQQFKAWKTLSKTALAVDALSEVHTSRKTRVRQTVARNEHMVTSTSTEF
jgi:hypothetical protein